MKIGNDQLQVAIGKNGEITAMAFNGIETLHTSGNWWPKTYPMIWPVTSFSRAFVVAGHNYELPKHGFWNQLPWNARVINATEVALTARCDDLKRYPFTIDIQHQIRLAANTVAVTTSFLNLSAATAYFNFGHHPAFRIDKGSFISVPSGERPGSIDGKGRYWPAPITVDNKAIMALPFGASYDTLVFKNFADKSLVLHNDHYDLTVKSGNFSALQLWKPKDALFLCIEPWQGWNDDETPETATEAKHKREIVQLRARSTITFTTSFTFTLKNHR